MGRQRKCSILECGREHHGYGYCSLHYRRWKRHGDPYVFTRTPASSKGCLFCSIYAREMTRGFGVYYWFTSRNSKQIPIHRLIMEHYLGRKLKRTEIVHHGDKIVVLSDGREVRDNSFTNMTLCSSRAEHVEIDRDKLLARLSVNKVEPF